MNGEYRLFPKTLTVVTVDEIWAITGRVRLVPKQSFRALSGRCLSTSVCSWVNFDIFTANVRVWEESAIFADQTIGTVEI